VYFCVLFLSFLVSLFLSFSLAFNFSFSLSFIYSINHRRFWVNTLRYAASCPEDVTCIIAVARMSRPSCRIAPGLQNHTTTWPSADRTSTFLLVA
jgi:hypothetical protein